jgi:hypothetical protein
MYAGTKPARRLDIAINGPDEILARDVDVGLGRGSSLDVPTVASVLAAAHRSHEAPIETFR